MPQSVSVYLYGGTISDKHLDATMKHAHATVTISAKGARRATRAPVCASLSNCLPLLPLPLLLLLLLLLLTPAVLLLLLLLLPLPLPDPPA